MPRKRVQVPQPAGQGLDSGPAFIGERRMQEEQGSREWRILFLTPSAFFTTTKVFPFLMVKPNRVGMDLRWSQTAGCAPTPC